MTDKVLKIDITNGGSKVTALTLKPEKPSNNQAGDWALTSSGESISDIKVTFPEGSTPVEEQYERAVLVIDMHKSKKPDPKHTWRFIDSGVQYCNGQEDINHDITTKISNGGKTLTVVITEVGDIRENVQYSFLASCTNVESGVVKTYTSKDPAITINRKPR